MYDILFNGVEIGSVTLTEKGIVLICHVLTCKECGSYGCAYINMANVDGYDKVHESLCPLCKREELVLITYRVLEEIIKNQEETGDTEEDSSGF